MAQITSQDSASNASASASCTWRQKLRICARERFASYEELQANDFGDCVLMNPQELPPCPAKDPLSTVIPKVFVYPRKHAQFVVVVQPHEKIPVGSIALTRMQLSNLELCVDDTEWFSSYEEQVARASSLLIEIRPFKAPELAAEPAATAKLTVNAEDFGVAFKNFTAHHILTENERFLMRYQDMDFFIRVMDFEAEDMQETEYTMPDIYRAKIHPRLTDVYVTLDGKAEDYGEFFELKGIKERPVSHIARTDLVTVITNDEEEFVVRKKLMYSCHHVAKEWWATRNHIPFVTSVKVDLDCLTFDRVLLFLQHQVKDEPEQFKFSMEHAKPLLEAAQKLGCEPLEVLCKKRIAEFESKLQKPPIRWADVLKHNACGDAWLLIDGMVLDLTNWLDDHPGGSTILREEALNLDSTVLFEINHAGQQAFQFLKQFYLGELALEDRHLVPKSNEKPSEDFLKELREFTSWRRPSN